MNSYVTRVSFEYKFPEIFSIVDIFELCDAVCFNRLEQYF